MPTKYRAFHDTIEKVEVLGETPTMVTLQHPTYTGRVQRERKESDYIFWADTWEEAHGWIMKNAFKRLEKAQLEQLLAFENIDKLQKMQPPTE